MDKRTLTLVVEIEDKEAAEWIWDNHLNKEPKLKTGLRVKSITSGDQHKMIDIFITEYQKIWRKMEKTFSYTWNII